MILSPSSETIASSTPKTILSLVNLGRPAKDTHTNNWSKELCKPVGGRLSPQVASFNTIVVRENTAFLSQPPG